MVSRKSDMMKSGSHRIAPKEIEEIILHQIVFLDELPKTATGKIKKADLK